MARAESIALQGEVTRAMILDVAIELFRERGYRGCTLAQIAARTGIVQSGLLHHFGSKERLLQEALNDHYPQLSERPEAA